MADKRLVPPVIAAVPLIVFALSLLAASISVGKYLDATEQLDIRTIDNMYLTHLDLYQQGQYQEYRQHRVYPDPAARWVGSERELKELRQWIKQHDMVIQAALSHEGPGNGEEALKNWVH